MLESLGQAQYRGLLGVQKSTTSFATVPGGLSPLAFAAHAIKEEISPERFFLEYGRMLVNGGADRGKNKYLDTVEEYFARLAALRVLSTKESGDYVITLSLSDKHARHQTDKALDILGIRLKNSKGEVELSQGEKKSQATRQETAAALALDEVGIQEALQAGKAYRLVIHDEAATVYPSEQTWRDSLNLKNYGPGGFAQELVRVPRMASTYVGLNSMDRGAAEQLLRAVPLKDLVNHDADLLFYFAPALALEGTHAAVPGGPNAEPIWTSMVGVSPASPGMFFRALLKHDEGHLLVFFSMLAELDRAHQKFFTASEARTKRIYDLMLSTDELRSRSFGEYKDSAFQRMLRSVPLEGEGHVAFPGSPEVWMVAKGHSSDEQHTAHLMKKVNRVAAPELEDTLLERLTDTKYKDNRSKMSELANFLAVASIDAHRPDPMDEESALLLAQKYAAYSAIYPYLTDLRTLKAEDYRQFFTAYERAASHSNLDANLQLGQLHALTEWICLLVQRRVIKDEQASTVLRSVTAAFAAAEDGASYTSASLKSVLAILKMCNADLSSADEALRTCLLGRHASVNDERMKNFVRVLDAQRVPSLNSLLEIHNAVESLGSAKLPAAQADLIQKAVNGLPTVDIPKEAKVSGEAKSSIIRYETAPARKIAEQLHEKAGKRKLNPKDLQKLARELEGELQGQVTAAVAGPIYAYFLRSSDSVAMNDPLLLRKHHYYGFDVQGHQHERMIASDFVISTDSIGSYFSGGFAQFAYSAGLAAAHSKNLAGANESLAAQLATIRNAEWDRLSEADLRLASLRILVAREWIYESARNQEVMLALGEQTMGLLSLSRRAELLNGIAAHEWRRVWDAISLPELFALGDRYLNRFPNDPWPSEATKALRLATKNQTDSMLNVLGPIPTHIFGCNHAHLISDAPYEDYQHHLPVEMGERSAEFQLFLAFQADRLGVEPQTLENADEKLAVKAFRKAQMVDFRDWRALINAYASVTPSDLQQALRNE